MTRNQKIGVIIIVSSLFFLLLFMAMSKTTRQEKKRKAVYGDNPKETLIVNNTEILKKDISSTDMVIANRVLSDFFYAINSKDYDKAYSMIDEGYINDFRLTKAFFKLFYEFDEEKIFTVMKIDAKTEDRLVVTLNIESSNIENGKGFMEKQFTIFKKGEDKYTLADKGILSERELDMTKQVKEGVTASIIKEFKMIDGSAFVLKIDNKSERYFNIKDDKYGFFAVEEGVTYPHLLYNLGSSDYKVTPGISESFIVYFKKPSYPESIGLIDMDEDEPLFNSEGKKVMLFKF